MLIPLNSDQLCPAYLANELLKRSEFTETTSSFKSWDSCMNNKTCKIIAIVGIVLASIVVFGIIGSLIRCIFCGVRGFTELFCCCFSCCRCCCSNDSKSHKHNEEKQLPKSAYDNPYMYPPQDHYNPNYQPHMNYAPVAQPQFQYGPGVVSDEVNHGQRNGYNDNGHNQGYGYGQSGGHTYKGQFV